MRKRESEEDLWRDRGRERKRGKKSRIIGYEERHGERGRQRERGKGLGRGREGRVDWWRFFRPSPPCSGCERNRGIERRG